VNLSARRLLIGSTALTTNFKDAVIVTTQNVFLTYAEVIIYQGSYRHSNPIFQDFPGIAKTKFKGFPEISKLVFKDFPGFHSQTWVA